jgi:hypothetical protein
MHFVQKLAALILLIAVPLSYLAAAETPAPAAAASKSTTAHKINTPSAKATAATVREEYLGTHETVHVPFNIKKELYKVMGDAPAGTPECSITCSSEVGGINCADGVQCSCACIAGFAKCECTSS